MILCRLGQWVSGYPASWCGVVSLFHLTDNWVDAIIEARTERISALLQMCYKLVDKYQSTSVMAPGNTTVCTSNQSGRPCDSLVYGCLIAGLQSLKLFPKRAEASEIESSVMALADKLRSLNCFTFPDNYDHYSHPHSSCGFVKTIRDQIRVIINQKEPSGVLKEHLTHIAEQKK